MDDAEIRLDCIKQAMALLGAYAGSGVDTDAVLTAARKLYEFVSMSSADSGPVPSFADLIMKK